MVPADCTICKRRLMIWDVSIFWCRRRAGVGKIRICNECLPDSSIEEEEDLELDFRRPTGREQTREVVDQNPQFSTPEPGSLDRFVKRKREVPWLRHTLWWIIHNCVSHPLIGVLPLAPFFKFHDWTSYKMHGKNT